ncbi:MAG: hypothetical protein NC191_03325 [Muribaculaceae bacterium]|nr:hypothetical protein [Muribaculaceae bacterium]
MRILSNNITKYIQSISPQVRNIDFPLEKLELTKLEGIQKDIPLFETTSLQNIRFISKWFQVLNLARGCTEQCTFCLRNAMLPLKENSEKISTILWDDLIRFTRGFSKLNERLGFNILRGNTHITLFEDANLPVINMKDAQGNNKSLTNAVKEIYDRLNLPLVFVTSGWNPADKSSQIAAEELCRYIQQTPDSIKEFAISVNPFQRYNRNIYISRIVNALKTFLPLYKNNNEIGSILVKYNYPTGIKSDENGYLAAKKLYEEIYENLKLETRSTLEDYEILKPEKVTIHREDNYIENKGRGQNFFPQELVKRNNKKLFVESFRWFSMTEKEKLELAYDCTTKNIDINGHIYLITPSEQLIETNMGLNFINKDKITAPIHSDIRFTKLT